MTVSGDEERGAEVSDEKVLYLVCLTPEPGYEDKFNDWYDNEHVPELLACPGFEEVRRWEQIEGIPGSPRYLAIYTMTSMDAFTSPEYQKLRNRTREEYSELALEVEAHRSRDINAKYRQILHRVSE